MIRFYQSCKWIKTALDGTETRGDILRTEKTWETLEDAKKEWSSYWCFLTIGNITEIKSPNDFPYGPKWGELREEQSPQEIADKEAYLNAILEECRTLQDSQKSDFKAGPLYVTVDDEEMVTNGRISLGYIDAGDLDHYFPQGMDREQWNKVSKELLGWVDDNIHSVIQNIVNGL